MDVSEAADLNDALKPNYGPGQESNQNFCNWAAPIFPGETKQDLLLEEQEFSYEGKGKAAQLQESSR
jgi:hypothetical protein